MFYSQFILAKKGPLGTIWIAAHLERKLRKNQVADTDIGLSVDSILSQDVPIALRLSSHLMLGVVRIYSRKVNYLFHDCSEALLKVKQAFRSTAVDLPPEESTAPYHSITLPETFHLDDFELPDSAFQGDFIDHHVSSKEQITLQDTMDGAGFSSMQFGLDERFGDGIASHIGLDLDEDIFLDKHLSSQHILLSPSPHECSGHQHQSSSMFDHEMEIGNQNEFVKDENAEFSNDKPVLSNDYDRQNVEHKKKDDLSSQCQRYSVQTPDLNEVFSTNNDLEEPPPYLIGCAHAPSTPGLEDEILNASAHESPAFSPLQKLSPSIGEANVRLDECPNVMTVNDLVHGIAMDPDSINPMQVGPSSTSVSLEQIDLITVPDETRAEFGQDTASVQNSFLPGEAKELLIDDQGRYPGEAILCNESQTEDIRLPTSSDASDPKVPFDGSVLDNGVIHSASKISSDSVLASEEALVDKHAEDAWPSCSSLEYIVDVNLVPSNSSFPFRSCTMQANLPIKLAAEDGAAVQKALQVSAQEQGVQSLESARELFQDDDFSSGKDYLIGNAADASLQVHENFGDSVTEAALHIASANQLLAGHLQKDTHLEQLNSSSTSDFLEPEKMLLAPPGEQDQANDLSQISEKGVTESDGSVNRVSSLSGRKRPLDESASFLQNAKLSARPRLKSNSEQIPDDDDLLASILVGKRTPLLRLGSTPPPAKEASLKRPRTQSRLGTAKRKVLLDDTTILHADVIRQQLINTEDTRRTRKKAPCTRPEIWMIRKSCLEDEIFDEPILTGISEKLTYLQTLSYNSKVRQHLYAKPSKEYDLSKTLELEATEIEKNKADLVVQANKDGATEELCGPSGSDEANSDKIIDHHQNLLSLPIPLPLDSSDNAASLKNSTKDLSEHEKDGLPMPSGSDSPCRLDCEAGAHHITDEISLDNSNTFTSLLEKSDDKDIQKVQASVDGLAKTGDEPFAVNDALSHSSKSACTEGLDAVVNPECMMVDNEAQTVTDDVNMIHVEGSYDATNSCIMKKYKGTNCVLDSSMHEVEAANVTSSPLQSMLMQNDQLAELAVTADHQVMGDGESVLVAQLNVGTVQPLIDEESTIICEERPEHTSECANQPNGGYGNAPSVVGETSDLHAFHLEGDVVVESMPMDSTTAKETSDFCSAVNGNDTDFLNVDDEEDYEEAAGDDMPDTQDTRSLENSGWSSRTRGVARYLKTLFDDESGLGRKVVVMDQLIAGKTRKEASRMFFETLVLKTKDYIHVEQQNPCDSIAIKPRAKLLKSEF